MVGSGRERGVDYGRVDDGMGSEVAAPSALMRQFL